MTEQFEIRCGELHALGLKYNGEYYQDKKIGVFIHYTDITCEPEEKWQKIISQVKKLRIKESNEPLTEKEKDIAFAALNIYLEKNPDMPYDTFSAISDFKDRLNPDFRKVV